MSGSEYTYEVLLAARLRVESALLGLAKKATRKGITPLSWLWGKAYTEEVVQETPSGERVNVKVERIPLTLTGETPKYDGWSFQATLQHLDGENIVRSLPGVTLDKKFRTRGPVCDHCKYNRRRHETFVLNHEDGRTVQVGSTCISDFLGSDEAHRIAARAVWLAAACALAEDGCENYGSSGQSDRTLEAYLPFVAWCVREQGWTSRTAAREHEGLEATADKAWLYLIDHRAAVKANVEITDEDKALALSSQEWAESIPDSDVEVETGDYLHNLRAVMRTGLVTHKTGGIGASCVVAYQRHIGKERARLKRAEMSSQEFYVGVVGQKVTFGLPPQVGKRGKPLKNAPLALSEAPVTLEFVTGYDTQFGYTTILKFRTAEGACLVWKASNTDVGRDDVGKTYKVWGSIKAHEEYKGSKQTILTRCSVNVVEVAA